MAVKISLIGRGVRVIILVSIASNLMLASEENIPVRVSRRLSGDIYQYFNFTHQVCQDNLTYLVSEDRCVNDEELFNDCGFGFVSSEAPSNLTTALVFSDQSGNIFEQLKILVDSSDAAVTVINSKHQFVNGSLCQIASLEVYRGRDQIIEINHDGLSLSENGMVKVDPSSLSYNTSEYEGELYRMNLSCSGGKLPESGCVFFKLRGITNLTYAKFSSTVMGSLNSLNASEQDTNFDATTQSETTTWTDAINTVNSYTTDFLSNTMATHFESTGNTDLVVYVAVGAAGGIVILFITIFILCMCVYRLMHDSREPICIPVTVQQQVQLQIQDHIPQGQEESLYNNILDSQFNVVDSNFMVTDQSGHAYAEDQDVERTGQAQPSFAPVNQHHQRRQQQRQTSIDAGTSTIKPAPAATGSCNNMRRTKSQKDNLDVVTFETFKPKLEGKRSISLSSAWETTMTTAASRSTDCELYDTVTPAAKIRGDERDLGFSKLSYPSCPMKDPLPSCTDAIPSSSSMLYASLCIDSTDYGSVYDVPKKEALAYAIPDMKKKREKKQESKDWSDTDTVNPEESMLNNFCGHYDTPKSKYIAEKEITASSKVSSLYDQPRIIKPNIGN